MDYCSSCRRHLNGALVCPGCGAYAPDIAPATIDSRVAPSRSAGTTTGSVMIPMPPTTPAAPVPAATWEYGVRAGDGWHDAAPMERFPADGAPMEGFPADGSPTDGSPTKGLPTVGAMSGSGYIDADADADLDVDVDVDVEGVPVAPQGRAARRRQLARWKKNQRRAVVATAVALVGGGLTVMGMDRQSTDRTQAATAPDAESLGSVEEQGSQRGRTPTTETDDAKRTSDTPKTWSPSGDTSRDRSAADKPNARADHPNSPRTASATPPAQGSRSGSSGTGRTATDAATGTGTGTPTDETTTPPATDDSGSAGDTGKGTGSDTGTGTGTGSGSGNDSGSDTGSGTGSDTSDGSSSDTATTSPSGLCLLGIVCVN
ncbi:SCO2400 family protein [Streptomyces sp. NBC_00391]|uniref:SCO2400 family protein n=1 Tax=Streptomyces sp. NBC_00391 TaxID=2903647 RepID=UPI003FA7C813